jgi:hypothetical protein
MHVRLVDELVKLTAPTRHLRGPLEARVAAASVATEALIKMPSEI